MSCSLLLPLAQSQNDTATMAVSCKELGSRYAKCALATAAKIPCPANWDFVRPIRCKQNSDFEVGITEGTKEFGAAIISTQKDSKTSPVAAASIPKPQRAAVKRRLSAAECRLMERAIPSAASRLGAEKIGISQLRAEIEEDTNMPEATGALIGYLVMYRSDSLRAFSYEMASDFSKKCLSGAIRTE